MWSPPHTSVPLLRFITREKLFCIFGEHLWEIGSQNKNLWQPVILLHGALQKLNKF